MIEMVLSSNGELASVKTPIIVLVVLRLSDVIRVAGTNKQIAQNGPFYWSK